MATVPASTSADNRDQIDAEAITRLEEILGEKMAPKILQARQAFRRDLPELLRDHPRRWVAYHGDQRIAVGATKTALYQDCLRRGLQRDQFLVLLVEPEMPDEIEVPIDV
jgi:hypothetical protein